MNEVTFISSVILSWMLSANFNSIVLAMPRSKNYRNPAIEGAGTGEVMNKADATVNSEPSCEELKAMWRFSKRQSRAAEVTNEIPTYKDPFSYNIWEPYYARSRTIGGMRASSRFRTRPVYGRVSFRVQDLAVRNKAFEDFTRLYGTTHRGKEIPQRHFRLGGGGSHAPHMTMTPQSGSFQHLKELIRTERARELQEQRIAEEVAARAAVFKDISNGNLENHRQQNLRNSMMYTYGKEDNPLDLQRNDMAASHGVLSFPDLLAPAARPKLGAANLVVVPKDGFLQHLHTSSIVPHRSMYSQIPYSINPSQFTTIEHIPAYQ